MFADYDLHASSSERNFSERMIGTIGLTQVAASQSEWSPVVASPHGVLKAVQLTIERRPGEWQSQAMGYGPAQTLVGASRCWPDSLLHRSNPARYLVRQFHYPAAEMAKRSGLGSPPAY